MGHRRRRNCLLEEKENQKPFFFFKKKKSKRKENLTSNGVDLALARDSDRRGDSRGNEEEGDHGGELHFDRFDFVLFFERAKYIYVCVCVCDCVSKRNLMVCNELRRKLNFGNKRGDW